MHMTKLSPEAIRFWSYSLVRLLQELSLPSFCNLVIVTGFDKTLRMGLARYFPL